MISFEEAFRKVLKYPLNMGDETVSLPESTGRILSEDITADRDFPPFHRSTKDGIAINFSAIGKGIDRFEVEGVLSAGMAQESLSSEKNCFEIMTGAVLPKNADTIIMYEDTGIENGYASISKSPKKGQNIHTQGSDAKAGSVLLEKGIQISAAVVGVLASVGKTEVSVKKLPKVCVISTGNELVDVSEMPLPHQIRKSNTLSLTAALKKVGITPTQLHLADERKTIEDGLREALGEHDVLMLSGGVSKGKFDFVPDALEKLGVQKVFHRVAQRPGKPFWFGTWGNRLSGDQQRQVEPSDHWRTENQRAENRKKVVFSFPGNPVSTFANFHLYFLPWLKKCLQTRFEQHTDSKPDEERQHLAGADNHSTFERPSVILDEPIQPHDTLTLFLQVQTEWRNGMLHALLIQGNGSGDLVSLAKADGFIQVPAGDSEISKGNRFKFISCV